jgi:hypothetical protein
VEAIVRRSIRDMTPKEGRPKYVPIGPDILRYEKARSKALALFTRLGLPE